jgi:hypothetical protein
LRSCRRSALLTQVRDSELRGFGFSTCSAGLCTTPAMVTSRSKDDRWATASDDAAKWWTDLGLMERPAFETQAAGLAGSQGILAVLRTVVDDPAENLGDG